MAYNTVLVSRIKDTISQHIKTYFQSTLGQEPDIVNIFNSLVYLESGFNPSAVGPTVSSARGTTGFSYISSSCIQSILTTGSPTQKSNVYAGLNGLSLCQVMGWNFVRGAAPGGKCEIEMRRPDLAGTLCIAPGDSLPDWVLGDGNISKSLLAGLVILESKYKAVQYSNRKYYFSNDKYNRVFDSRISAAVAGYLGLGASDKLGTTPQEYSQRIVGGSTYRIANGTNPAIGQSNSQVVSTGPATNGSGMQVIVPAGC